MKCLVVGGTGFIGRVLARRLQPKHEVTVWNRQMSAQPTAAGLQGMDAVINLAGETVAQRWSADVKRRIHDSRVLGTRNLVAAMAMSPVKPMVLISASAIGIYGERGDEILSETSEPGTGFLSDVCKEWEAEADRAAMLGVRVVKLRIGFVLGRGGGALAKIVPAFRLFAGGRLGSGRQWMPWIHVDDVTELIVHALSDQSVSGVWNATSPHPVQNSYFTRELARAVHRPALFPVPSLALRLAFGEFGQHMLDSARVVPEAALKSGFQFRYPELKAALQQLVD